jgi:hypothetical protein
MPLHSFPAAWNAEINEKINPSQAVYLRSLKKVVFSKILKYKFVYAVPPPLNPHPLPILVPLMEKSLCI